MKDYSKSKYQQRVRITEEHHIYLKQLVGEGKMAAKLEEIINHYINEMVQPKKQ